MRENRKDTTFKNQVSKTGQNHKCHRTTNLGERLFKKNGVETIFTPKLLVNFTNNNASNIELVVKFSRKTETVQ